ncbi:MAG: hypothetical protein JNK72_01210 [Myxococcales bacterium]|nr:hypothetical protein [Myxococcales bacterium]
MPIRAGQEIDAYCTRCKMDLTHRVIAVVGDKPVKVECRTCYSSHNYRPPKSAAAATRVVSAASASRGRTTAEPARRARASVPEDHVALVPPSHAHLLPFKMTERYRKDQWLAHKTFGIGLVMAELADNKIEVRFESGVKVLVHNRTEE